MDTPLSNWPRAFPVCSSGSHHSALRFQRHTSCPVWGTAHGAALGANRHRDGRARVQELHWQQCAAWGAKPDHFLGNAPGKEKAGVGEHRKNKSQFILIKPELPGTQGRRVLQGMGWNCDTPHGQAYVCTSCQGLERFCSRRASLPCTEPLCPASRAPRATALEPGVPNTPSQRHCTVHVFASSTQTQTGPLSSCGSPYSFCIHTWHKRPFPGAFRACTIHKLPVLHLRGPSEPGFAPSMLGISPHARPP